MSEFGIRDFGRIRNRNSDFRIRDPYNLSNRPTRNLQQQLPSNSMPLLSLKQNTQNAVNSNFAELKKGGACARPKKNLLSSNVMFSKRNSSYH